MKVVFGLEGSICSKKEPFPIQVLCRCGGRAELAVTYADTDGRNNVASLFATDGKKGSLWPTGSVAIAVYICRRCMEVSAKMTEAV